MAWVRSSTGQAGNLFDCDLPCFTIDGYTNDTFRMGCSACDGLVDYSMANPAWDGSFRPWVPVVVGENNHWDGCTYYGNRNGASYNPGIINGKVISSIRMSTSPTGTIVTISCDESGTPHTIWQGTSDDPHPDGSPIKRNAGCGSGVQEITLTKTSPFDCLCQPSIPTPCPQFTIVGGSVEVDECNDEDEGCSQGNAFCWIFMVDGFTGSPCSSLNGLFTVTDSPGACFWGTSSRAETSISCRVLDGKVKHITGDDLQGAWHMADGIGTTMEGIMAQVVEDEKCPPRPTVSRPETFTVYGSCNCVGQQTTAKFWYGYCDSVTPT